MVQSIYRADKNLKLECKMGMLGFTKCILIYRLVVWVCFLFSIFWEQSSQLTFILFRGVVSPPTINPFRLLLSPKCSISSAGPYFLVCGRGLVIGGRDYRKTPCNLPCIAVGFSLWNTCILTDFGPWIDRFEPSILGEEIDLQNATLKVFWNTGDSWYPRVMTNI